MQMHGLVPLHRERLTQPRHGQFFRCPLEGHLPTFEHVAPDGRWVTSLPSKKTWPEWTGRMETS